MERDMLRQVRFPNGYVLRMWDTHTVDEYHKSVLGYSFESHDGSVLFTGMDFACGAGTAIDSDDCVEALASFLTLRPGDTDAEYFVGYSTEQMAFAHGEAEAMQIDVMEHTWEEIED